MNKIEELKKMNEEIERKFDEIYKEKDFNLTTEEFRTLIKPLMNQQEENEKEIKKIMNESVQVGDGITIDLYSDSHAYTIIKRTAKSITIQQDKATLSKDFKPEFIIGGFAAHCTNQNEQQWTYERDPEGQIKTLYWSDKLNGWKTPYGYSARLGRHEFYDYNF